MVATPQPQRDANPDNLKLRQLLENSFQNHNLVSMAAGSPVPLLKGHVWLVVRSMTKLLIAACCDLEDMCCQMGRWQRQAPAFRRQRQSKTERLKERGTQRRAGSLISTCRLNGSKEPTWATPHSIADESFASLKSG